MRETGTQTQQVQSLTRALGLLDCLSQSDSGMNLTELSSRMDLAPSTAHRLLNSLLASGFVEWDEEQGLWSVGLKAFTIGNAYLKKRDFVAKARPFMKSLMQQVGETVNLATLHDDAVVFVAQVECKEVMRMVVQVGSRGPAHAAGVGKSILSTLPDHEAREILERAGMPRLTENTSTDWTCLCREFSEIRQCGYAVDDEEQKLGLRCIAANIYDETGEAISAVSISGPSVRVTQERIGEIASAVKKTASEITAAIGGTAPQ